ncbi:hypothetical protein [Neobacillus dielmonensis]|uniref:hypothetical protein n=1 Tax=Neobacillus dielmonensis TaxID=1347369 RepID=UPI0005A7AF5A
MIFVTPMAINLLGFKINTMDNGAITNLGPMQMIDQFVSYKRNQAVGEQNGDLSPINVPVSLVIDPDGTDSNTIKNSVI